MNNDSTDLVLVQRIDNISYYARSIIRATPDAGKDPWTVNRRRVVDYAYLISAYSVYVIRQERMKHTCIHTSNVATYIEELNR